MYKRTILVIFVILAISMLAGCKDSVPAGGQVIFQPLSIQISPIDFSSAEKILSINVSITPNNVTLENPEIEVRLDKSSKLLTDFELITNHFDSELVDVITIPLKIKVNEPEFHEVIVRITYDNSPNLKPRPLEEGEGRAAGIVNVVTNTNDSRLYSEERFIFEVDKNFDINYRPDLSNKWGAHPQDPDFVFLKKQQNINSDKIESEFYFSDTPQIGRPVTLTYRITPSFDIEDWDNNKFSSRTMGMWIRTGGLKILNGTFIPDLPEGSTGTINGKIQNGLALGNLAVWASGPVVKKGETAEIVLVVEPISDGWGYVYGHYGVNSTNASIHVSDTKAYFVFVDGYKPQVSDLITEFKDLHIPLSRQSYYTDYFFP